MKSPFRKAGLVAALSLLTAPAFAAQTEDVWITTKVKMALLTDDTVDGLDLDVDTFDGRVTLHGKVDSSVEKAEAETLARKIEGVSHVRNLLAIVPATSRKANEVKDDALSARATAEVREVAGVKGVENELQVVPEVAAKRVEAEDEQVREAVRKRLEARDALEDADIDVAVENGVVRLTGTVATQRDRLTALTVARSTDGVGSVIDGLERERPQG